MKWNGDSCDRTPVLLVSPCAMMGGAERVFLGLARSMPAVGSRPTAVLLQPGPLEDQLRDAGCETHTLLGHRMRDVVRTARTVQAVRRLARSTKARAVVSNMWNGQIVGGLAASTARVPSIFWQHVIPAPSLSERTASAVPSRLIICSSDAAVAAQRAVAPNRKVRKVHPGVRLADVLPSRGKGQAIRRALGWEHNTVVGIVGRLEPGKGQQVFLQAAARIARLHPEARFVVVGGALLGSEGSYPEELRRLSEGLGLADRTHFAGHQTDIYPWYDALDIAVNASSVDSFGLVLIEAMLLGKPLVATAIGGQPEIVEDGVSGLLVPPYDPERLANAIDHVLTDLNLRSRLGRAAVERAKVFSEECMSERFAEALRSVIAQERASQSAMT
jgi:glycosyltransferase involved in cell wall biosynthesis